MDIQKKALADKPSNFETGSFICDFEIKLQFPNRKFIYYIVFGTQGAMQIQTLGIVLIPIIVYQICNQYFLNRSELLLLVSSLLMLTSLVFYELAPWITHVAYLILMGWHIILSFVIARNTYFFDRHKSTHTYSKLIQTFFTVDEQEIMLVLYSIIVWIWIRITSLKNLDYIVERPNHNFVQVFGGWNCQIVQFWGIPALWLIFTFLSVAACKFLIRYEFDRNNLYKEYFLSYKILPDIITLASFVLFNFIAYQQAENLQGCLPFFESGLIFRMIWFWGCPASTIYFLFQKSGVFQVEGGGSKDAESVPELQEALNHQQIQRQHSKIDQKSQQK